MRAIAITVFAISAILIDDEGNNRVDILTILRRRRILRGLKQFLN
jgi:hypothetical protein